MRPRRLIGRAYTALRASFDVSAARDIGRPLNFTVRGRPGGTFVNTAAAASQSTFVTVLAWLTIVLSGFATLVGLMQNVMLNFVMPGVIANAPNASANAFPLVAARAFLLAFLCFVAFMTYVGYALLKRRNWARRTLIVLCALGIAWAIFCILMFAFGFGLWRFPTAMPPGAPPGMDSAFKAMLVMTSVLSLGMCVLFGWIIKRLRSASVRAEFNDANAVP
jgi:hypothetical protein